MALNTTYMLAIPSVSNPDFISKILINSEFVLTSVWTTSGYRMAAGAMGETRELTLLLSCHLQPFAFSLKAVLASCGLDL